MIKTLFKRILAFSMIISLSMGNVAYAAGGADDIGIDANGQGGENISGPSTVKDVMRWHIMWANQGFRVYMIDKDGVLASNTVDFVNYRPWDFKAGQAQNKETAFDLPSAVKQYWDTTGMYESNKPKNRMVFMGGVKSDDTFTINTISLTPDGEITSTNQSNNVGVTYYNPYTKKVEQGKMYTISDLYWTLYASLITYYPDFDFASRLNGIGNVYEYIDPKDKLPKFHYTKIVAPLEGDLNGVPGLTSTGSAMINFLSSPIYTDEERYKNDQTIIAQYLAGLKLHKVDGLGRTIDENKEDLFYFLNPEYQKQFKKKYDDLPDREKAFALIEVMRENNIVIGIEPISWQVPGITSSVLGAPYKNKLGVFWSSDYIVYGSPSKVAYYMISDWEAKMMVDWTRHKLGNTSPVYKYDKQSKDYAEWDKEIKERNAGKFRFLPYDYMKDKQMVLEYQWGNMTAAGYTLSKDYAFSKYVMEKYQNNEKGMVTFADGKKYLFHPSDLWALTAVGRYVGFSVMYLSVNPTIDPVTDTWDTTTYPSTNYEPGPSPQTTNPDGTFPSVYPSEGEKYKTAKYEESDEKSKDHNFNIVKFYATKNPDGSYDYISNFTRKETLHKIILNDEPGYKVDNWFTSPEFKEPESDTDSYDEFKENLKPGEQSGKTSGRIEVKPESADKTLYMRLVSEDEPDINTDNYSNIIPLYENEVSKQTSLSSVLPSANLKITNTLPSVPNDIKGSRYKEQYRSEGSQGWKAWYNYHNPSLTGADSDLIGKPAPFETQYTGLASGTRTVKRASITSVPQSFNSKFSIWRGMDRPTLVAYKPEDTENHKSELKVLGLPEGTTPQSSRGKTGQPTDISGIIQKSFTSQFEVDDSNSKYNIETEYRIRDGYWGGKNGNRWKWYPWTSWSHYSTDYGTTNPTSLATLLTKVYYYLGKPNTGDKQSSDNNSLEFKILTKTMGGGTEERVFNGKGTAIQTSQAITLYPYTQMKYNTTQNSAWKNVYTLSNYLSTIHNTDFVDLAYSKKNTNSLELNSTQWSTHSRSIKAVGKDNALPGGALHNLSTPDENNTQVALRIFQTVTPDTIQPALQSGYDYYNSGAAQARRDDLINQVTESLSNLSVVQYVNEGITKDLKQLIGGVMVQSSGNQQVFKNTTSTDSKYFFKFAKTQADGGAINIKKSDDITETTYSISSFINGDVKVYKNGAEMLGISKTEDINKILSNPELKELDEKTKFFTNFLLAIDRNVGSDGSGQKWYNEAIDSLELHVYTQIFTLGFKEPFSTRSSVLDPKLIGQQDSKSDLYNYDDNSKVRSSVYLTYSKPTNQTQDGVFATWGESNTAIILPRLPYLFQSKIFYIPNATVQDLN